MREPNQVMNTQISFIAGCVKDYHNNSKKKKMDGGPGGGEGYKFLVKPSADLKCIECSQVAVEPWQHGKCGRLFCKLCLDQHGITNPCPECKTSEPMPRYFEDNRSKSRVRCRGCKSCMNQEGLERDCNLHFYCTWYLGGKTAKKLQPTWLLDARSGVSCNRSRDFGWNQF